MQSTNRISRSSRSGISPIIATVIIVAATLVAGVAVGGFVFGVFSTQTATAQVSSSSTSINSGAAGTNFQIRCLATGSVGSIVLRNTGVSNATVTDITIQYGSQSYTATNTTAAFSTFTGAGTGCGIINSGGTSTIYIRDRPLIASSGQAYIGEALLNDGSRVQFTGKFK
ncbi:MAG: hypothetical protein HYU39_08765 [Thaumarchaeota archaeon]|nr:hypothetical protein [Nitrososphaerota archaeon]